MLRKKNEFPPRQKELTSNTQKQPFRGVLAKKCSENMQQYAL